MLKFPDSDLDSSHRLPNLISEAPLSMSMMVKTQPVAHQVNAIRYLISEDISMQSYQVKFRCEPDPKNAAGIIMRFEKTEDLTHQPNPFTAIFRSTSELDSALIEAGIYLHSFGHADPERDVRPNPEESYEVTDEILRKLKFDIPY